VIGDVRLEPNEVKYEVESTQALHQFPKRWRRKNFIDPIKKECPQFHSVADLKSWIIKTFIEVQNPDFKINIRKTISGSLKLKGPMRTVRGYSVYSMAGSTTVLSGEKLQSREISADGHSSQLF
jgi:hypothetical protein